jgi:uncharacterized membrane protein YhaH (DUF805 family)
MWRRFFPLIFLFSCVDGFISNWMYPNRLPLLYRDVLILGVYVLFLIREPTLVWAKRLRDRVGRSAWFLAMLFLCVGIIQAFNPLLPAVLVGFLGFKVLFFYWPLAMLAFAYTNSLGRAQRLAAAIVLFSIPINLFGLYQFWQGPEFLGAAFGPGFERATALAYIEEPESDESFVRVIGTFASTGQYTGFLLVNSMLTIALWFTAERRLTAVVWVGCSLLNVLGMLATGSRTGLVGLAMEVALVVILCRRTWRALAVAVAAAVGLYYGFTWLGESVVLRFESLGNVEMVRDRTLETTTQMFAMLLERYPLGRGLGTGSTASRHLLGEDSDDWDLVENDLSKLQLETGIVGVAAFYLFLTALGLRWLGRWRRSLVDPVLGFVAPLSAYCLTRIAFAFIVGGFDSPPGSVFFWALVGTVARLSVPAARVRPRAAEAPGLAETAS